MTDVDPFASAGEVATAVSRGMYSAQDVVEATLERIDELDGALNSFSVVLANRARSDARDVDRRLAKGERLPLAGVPVAVKDHIWLAGTPATNGSRVLADFVPSQDAVVVERLAEAGAVIVGKTNNPEFCYRGDSDSPLLGVTSNPYNLTCTPGGSSGGSAVAVAAGLVPLALGADGGGSIRNPAAFCGVFGHKPTFGLVPTAPGFRGWPSLGTFGPMTRQAADLRLSLEVMAGLHSSDVASVPASPAFTAADRPEALTGLRIAFSEDFGFATVDPQIVAALRQVVGILDGLGCDVTEAHPHVTDDVVELWAAIVACESYASEGPLLDRQAAMTPFSVAQIRSGEAYSARDYLDLQSRRVDVARTWSEFFDRFDVILSPGHQLLPFRHEESDRLHGDFTSWGLDLLANLTGQPATSVPCGISQDGLPLGVQLMSRRFTDGRLLGIAAELAGHLEIPSPPPPFGPPMNGRADT